MNTIAENVRARPGAPARVAADSIDSEVLQERRRGRQRRTVLTWLIRLGALIVVIGAWQLASAGGLLDPLLVSTPRAVAHAVVSQLGQSSFWVDVRSTFSGAMAGLLGGAVLGIATGVAFSRWEILDHAFKPFLTLVNSLPRPALAPIFILWFGLGFMPKAMVAASIVYFVLLTTTASALRTIDHDVMLLTRSLSMSVRQRFFKIELPSALPSIVGGLRLGAVYAVLGAVVSEMVGAYSGLGQRLVVMTSNFKVADSFAVLLAMGVMSMVLDYAISGLERLVRSRTR